ncbi:MAG: NAD(P)-binding domain-containing protein [Chthonomonadales bacterium]|nr:NAD(P)-binding domain-containing protein [Chthonomonadales bacterium]
MSSGQLDSTFDLVILGAGPAGLAAACEAQDRGLSHLIIDRRGLVHSFVEYPQTLRFFSPPHEMAIGGVPFPMRGGDKPTREDALAYYRGVAVARRLNLATWERVMQVAPLDGGYRIRTRREPTGTPGRTVATRCVALATGVWDRPRLLDCPGTSLPHVLSRFIEPTEYLGHPVLVVGGGNSAVTAALSLAEAHARVTLAMRRPAVPYQSHLRPFVVRDLELAVADGKIDLRVDVAVREVRPERAWLCPIEYDPAACRWTGEPYEVPARFIFALLGQTADTAFLETMQLERGPDGRPLAHPDTYETTRPGIYVAGSLAAQEVDVVVKGREQARAVVARIAERLRGCA